ncbi:MAG: D-alanyl-D-alanine carboxypeptidase [Spirochaetales bacterium]|uniref:D-alanyl-D-alanine carboxypeptidase n=1 Tax=Candidatus Thalassospirochaeta sargassi TaxID=3119039 RepID=A0AAJ1MPL3_9SPIO|nr:D-alanyl-D-alanine carboxypeptidase [Spirochaetales bacterium]
MKKIIRLLALMLIPAASVIAAPSVSAPEINAASAILIDSETGTVLFEKNADALIPPASMTKLMTIHTALEFINDGRAAADDLVPISANADFRNLPPRSSLMFLEEGQRVTLMELLQGLALPSGNDAGIAVAEYLAGSVEAFVGLMNEQAAKLGMLQTHFDDSSGLSEKNVTTAREYAEFCRYYIEKNSSRIADLHMLQSFTYPKTENLGPSGKSVHGPITQPNHNMLIGRMASVDGLKTGYIDESGFNFAATAVVDDRRLILVSMGGPGSNSSDGAIKRAIDAAVLLSYGFYAWSFYQPEVPLEESVRVYGGTIDNIGLVYSPADEILIRNTNLDKLEFVRVLRPIELPVEKGSLLGRWKLMLNEEELQSGIITAAESIEKGNIFKRICDALRKPVR